MYCPLMNGKCNPDCALLIRQKISEKEILVCGIAAKIKDYNCYIENYINSTSTGEK